MPDTRAKRRNSLVAKAVRQGEHESVPGQQPAGEAGVISASDKTSPLVLTKASCPQPPTQSPLSQTKNNTAGSMTPRRLLPWLGLLIFTGSAIGLLNKMAVNQPIETPGLGPPPSTVVVLDAGHGGADTGAVALGLAEKDLTLDVVRRIESNLARRGIATRLTRTKDVYVPLAARTRFANSLPNAIFVSIHFNHANNAPASGVETFYTERPEPLFVLRPEESGATSAWRWLTNVFSSGEGSAENAAPGIPQRSTAALPEFSESRALAACVQAALVTRAAAVDRGVKERRLFVTRNVRAPAVLVEGGFVSNPTEARALGDPVYRQRLADCVTDGIIEYLTETARRTRRTQQPSATPLAVTAATGRVE